MLCAALRGGLGAAALAPALPTSVCGGVRGALSPVAVAASELPAAAGAAAATPLAAVGLVARLGGLIAARGTALVQGGVVGLLWHASVVVAGRLLSTKSVAGSEAVFAAPVGCRAVAGPWDTPPRWPLRFRVILTPDLLQGTSMHIYTAEDPYHDYGGPNRPQATQGGRPQDCGPIIRSANPSRL